MFVLTLHAPYIYLNLFLLKSVFVIRKQLVLNGRPTIIQNKCSN